MIITYCEKCGRRVDEAELASGGAVRLDETKALCAKCAPVKPPVAAAARKSEIKVVLPAPQREAPSARHAPPAPAKPAPLSPGVIFGVAAAVAVILATGVLLLMRGKSDPKPFAANTNAIEPEPPRPAIRTPLVPDTPARPAPKPADPEPAVRAVMTDPEAQRKADEEIAATIANLAVKRLQDAKALAEQSPDDVLAIRAKLTEVANGYRSTPAGKEAAELLAQLKLPAPPLEEQWQGALDLVSLLDPRKDAVAGTWELSNGTLISQPADHARLQIYYVPPEEYDVRLSFARTAGSSVVGVVLAHGGRVCTFQTGSMGDAYCGFARVDGKNSSQNRTTITRSIGGAKHTVVVQVRKTAMTAFLDGEFLTRWCPAFGELSIAPEWKIREGGKLGLLTHFSTVQFFSVQLVEVTGKGALARAQMPETPAPPTPVANLPAVPADCATNYLDAFAEVAAAAGKEYSANTARLEALKADAKLGELRSSIDLDLELFKALGGLGAAARQGVSALIKDKRAVVLKTVDGKQQATGGDSKAAVIDFKDDALVVEQNLGGGKASTRVGFDTLAPQTVLELARLGLPPDAGNELVLGFAALVLQFQPVRDTPLKALRQRIEQAGKNGAPAEKVARVLSHLDALEKEQAAEAAAKLAEKLIADKRLEDARKAVEKFGADFAGTRSVRRSQPELARQLKELDKQLNPVLPGLWASYYASHRAEHYKKFLFSRAEKSLPFDYGAGAPDPRGPADYFGVIYHGLLRVPKAGKYRFGGTADDYFAIFLDGAEVLRNGGKDKDIDLEKGDHPFKVHFVEVTGNAALKFRIMDGNKDVSASLFFYCPWDTDAYDKEK